MARALSQVFSQIRGSTGGVTYLANQWHQIVTRARTSPVDPSTTNQNKVRQAFSGAAVDWLAQTPGNRELWDEYAQSLTYPNPLGNQTMPGRLVFMSNIGFMRYIYSRGFGLTTILKDAPTEPGFLSLDPLIIAGPGAPGTGVSVSVGNPNSEDISCFVWRSRPFAPTRNSYKGPWISSTMGQMDIPAASTGVYDFSVGTDDQAVFVYGRAIVDDGSKRVSQPFILRGIIDTMV